MNSRARVYLGVAGYFLACLVVSVIVGWLSFTVMVGRLGRCMMNLGCEGVPSTPLETVASYGLYAPYVLFMLGAFLTHRRLVAASVRKPVRFILVTIFLVFPAFAYASLPFVLRGIDIVREKAAEPKRKRLEEFESKLKSAPVVIEIKKARLIRDTDREAFIELTTEVRDVPAFLKYYELNIYGVEDDEHFPMGEGGEDSFKVFNEDGRWDFRGYHSNKSYTTGRDTFTTRVQYMKEAPLERPSRILFRLGIWAREDKVYERDCIFFYGWVGVPPSAFRETP